MATFGERLKATMALRGVTTQALARTLNTHEKNVERWRRSKHHPQLGNLIAIADALNVSLDYLAGRTTEPTMLPLQLGALDIPEGEERAAVLKHAAEREAATDAAGDEMGQNGPSPPPGGTAPPPGQEPDPPRTRRRARPPA